MKPGEVIPVVRMQYPDIEFGALQVPEVLCVFGDERHCVRVGLGDIEVGAVNGAEVFFGECAWVMVVRHHLSPLVFSSVSGTPS